ncbi:MAG: ABC transporter ATP-binding protein [Leptospiraceae bacterium]|nr:ABC transporter ATP-binding protein [Leptospiraceae bacterium]
MKAIEIRNLKKTYGNPANGGIEALKGIDLDVEEGGFFGLLGPNGAGKTTTIGILCSLVTKSAGQVKIFGHDIERELPQAKRCLGVVPQEFNFNIFESVEQIVLNQAGYYGMPYREAKKRSGNILSRLGLGDRKNTPAGRLSGGMKRRLMIARALIHEPRMLILDEPTAGVDIELRRSMWDFLKDINARTTIILTTHYLEEAEHLCRNIGIIDEGRLIENTTTRELLSKLDTETFVIDLRAPVGALEAPAHLLIRAVDDVTLEVDINGQQTLNDVFSFFESRNIQVESMRNKTNRLEELFLKLTA